MNCDRIARWYRWLEYLSFGRALERRRLEFLPQLSGARSALILGDGDGRFTAEFVRQNPAAIVDSVELSRSMLALARARIEKGGVQPSHLHLRQGDARTIELSRQYDLIVTHFFLDCFTPEELAPLIARISSAASPDAQWLISEFRRPGGGIPRCAAAILIRAMYFFFRIFTGLKTSALSDYQQLLALGGFSRLRYKSTLGGLLVSELWERLK